MVCPCIVFNKAYFFFQFYKIETNEELRNELCDFRDPFTLYFSNISGIDVVFKTDSNRHHTGFRAHYVIDSLVEGE